MLWALLTSASLRYLWWVPTTSLHGERTLFDLKTKKSLYLELWISQILYMYTFCTCIFYTWKGPAVHWRHKMFHNYPILNQPRERMTIVNISWSISTKECCRTLQGSCPQPISKTYIVLSYQGWPRKDDVNETQHKWSFFFIIYTFLFCYNT